MISGRSITTCRSKRPGRSNAGSRTSGRLVDAIRMTPACVSNPSISTRSAFRVCSRSSCPPPIPAKRWRPTASISSTKMMAPLPPVFAAFLACSKRSRTRAAPTPTNISTKSDPLIEKKGTPASPATALARSVFPVPGGPIKRTPFGIFPPRRVKRCGSFRNSIISCNSSLASSTPATSLNVIGLFSFPASLARDFPKLNTRFPPCCMPR